MKLPSVPIGCLNGGIGQHLDDLKRALYTQGVERDGKQSMRRAISGLSKYRRPSLRNAREREREEET